MAAPNQSAEPRRPAPWLLPTVLVLICLVVTSWALGLLESNRELAQQQGSSTSLSVPSSVSDKLEVKGQIDQVALRQELTEASEDFVNGNLSALVVEADSGQTLFTQDADKPRIPASNFKALTDYALLRTVDPDTVFSTSVKLAEKNLTLVAGGDSLLAPGESQPDKVVGRAGLKTLAQETIQALKDRPEKNYRLNLDTSMYSGPNTNPAWDPADISAGFVGPISPLAFYSHYSPSQDGSASTSRPSNAAQEVQDYLVSELKELGSAYGITVSLGSNQKAAAQAQTIAEVTSASAAEQSAYMMQQSDNMLAEVLGRNAAYAASGQGSFLKAKELIEQTLAKDAIPSQGLKIVDLCGLSQENRVTNTTLVALTRAIVTGQNGMDRALPGLPVAGTGGTLASRFTRQDQYPALGYTRAKTGTLNSVISLTGYTTSRSGQVLVFSLVCNDVTDTQAAKDTVDRIAAILTQAGGSS